MQSDRRSDILYALAVLLALYIAYLAIDVLLLVYVSALFAVVVAPAVGVVRRMRIGRWKPGKGTAMLMLLVALISLAIVFLVFALPPIFRDTHELAANWPMRSAQLVNNIRKVPFFENFNPPPVMQFSTDAFGGALGVFRNIAGGAFGLFYFIILMVYFTVDGDRAFHWGLSMFRADHRDRLKKTLLRAEVRMRHWLIGQSLLMLTLATCSLIVFGLLRIRYFYALAVFAGLLNIIPILGPATAVVLASLVALMDSPMKMLGVLVFFAIYFQLETALLTPRIMKASVDLPPLAVIVSLSLGAAIAGVPGALVAVPTAALCAVLIDEYLVKHDEVKPPLPAELRAQA